MKRAHVLKIAAGSVTLASLPALAAGCGDDDDGEEATQAVATQPVATTTGAQTAAVAQPTILFVDVDTVRGSKNLTAAEKTTQSCLQMNKYAKNEEIVFRVRVYDPVTGKALDDKQLAKVEVKLQDGKVLDPAKYGPHPKDPPNDSFWTTSFLVPENYPTGTLDFTVTATDNEKRTGTFTPLHYPVSATLQVTDTVRPVVPAQ